MTAAVALSLFPRLRATGLLDLHHVALVQRARPPAARLFSLPGGKLHRHEPIAACAAREALEELGVRPHLLLPPFTATDAIAEGYHYAIVHVAAWVWQDSQGALPLLRAGDDAAAAVWARVPGPPRLLTAPDTGAPLASSLPLAGPVLEVVGLAQRLLQAQLLQLQ